MINEYTVSNELTLCYNDKHGVNITAHACNDVIMYKFTIVPSNFPKKLRRCSLLFNKFICYICKIKAIQFVLVQMEYH